MTRRALFVGLAAWAGALTAASIAVATYGRIAPLEPPPREALGWAFAALATGDTRAAPAAPPASAEGLAAGGPIVVDVWRAGRRVGRHVGGRSFVEAVRDARAAFADAPWWRAAAPTAPAGARVDEPATHVVVTWPSGEGPLLRGIPFVSALSVVPTHEGLLARAPDGRLAVATPSDLRAARAYDGAVPTPIPDLSFGLDVERWARTLARELGLGADEVELRRFRAATLTAVPYPSDTPVDAEHLREAALEGAAFLLRHQDRAGAFTYLYDPVHGRPRPAGYNLTRHAGVTWFLAQAANLGDDPAAREGALRALAWIRRTSTVPCGDATKRCVASGGRGQVGATALTALAAAELVVGGRDGRVERLLRELTDFLRAQQRADGELQHEYDLAAGAPIDVQRMFASGEAALALLRAHDALGRPEDLEAAKRLLAHLTGSGWSFLGSRYYYGTEHWTCLSVGAAWARAPSEPGLDFCRRWAAWNAGMQYGPGDTPWRVAGAYGVGPLVVPRLTHAATNAEGMISVHEALVARGARDPALERVIERTLGLLLRWRFAPGPVHLFANPLAAHGGVPESAAHLDVRNDFVQHAGSAMLRWAAVLEREGRP